MKTQREDINTLGLSIGHKNDTPWSLRPWLLLKHFAIPFPNARCRSPAATTIRH